MASTSLNATSDHGERLSILRDRINDRLETLIAPSEPESLYEPVRYVLRSGGKRLRPLLVMLTGNVFGVASDRAMPAALAVEVLHNFTLVHDDIMDDSPLRRGQPTVHTAWDRSTALLAGDLLLGWVYHLVSQYEPDTLHRLIPVFHTALREVCEGQMLDTELEERPVVEVEDYVQMIDLKTGALIRASLQLGGYLGQASAHQIEILGTAGRHLGRAFQKQDDLLDLAAQDEGWGKRLGSDMIEGKTTIVVLRALEQADERTRGVLEEKLFRDNVTSEDIPELRRQMVELGVPDMIEQEITAHYDDARAALTKLDQTPGRDTLLYLVDRLESRIH